MPWVHLLGHEHSTAKREKRTAITETSEGSGALDIVQCNNFEDPVGKKQCHKWKAHTAVWYFVRFVVLCCLSKWVGPRLLGGKGNCRQEWTDTFGDFQRLYRIWKKNYGAGCLPHAGLRCANCAWKLGWAHYFDNFGLCSPKSPGVNNINVQPMLRFAPFCDYQTILPELLVFSNLPLW